MSDRVTWETCPHCGAYAAVRWRSVLWITGDVLAELPTEFDCPSGCEITREEFWTARKRRNSPGLRRCAPGACRATTRPPRTPTRVRLPAAE